jgi:phosphoribosylformimino-5-aminoimidazole carboxamide ribotide isomerase
MRILPVIDLMHGQVVRGVAGRRSEYKPIVSRLTQSTDPIDIALAFREHFGFHEIYLADLNAIAGRPPALSVFEALHRHRFHLWVDAGLRGAANAEPLLERGIDGIVAGLETIDGPAALSDLVSQVGPKRLVFSLDLKQGQPLLGGNTWPSRNAFAIADQAVTLGVQRMLVLDLAHVGSGAGAGTERSCRRLRDAYPQLEIAAGGGVRDERDVQSMRAAGVDWLLIASALHDGRLVRLAMAR